MKVKSHEEGNVMSGCYSEGKLIHLNFNISLDPSISLWMYKLKNV